MMAENPDAGRWIMPSRLLRLLTGGVLIVCLLASATNSSASSGRFADRQLESLEDLLPDLVLQAPAELRVQILDGRRILRLTTTAANRGEGHLELSATRTTASNSEMPAVQHIYQRSGGYLPMASGSVSSYEGTDGEYAWHIQDFVEYRLAASSDPTVVVVRRTGLCPTDDNRMVGSGNGQYFDCGSGRADSRATTHGISAGWSDVTALTEWTQWIDLTGISLGERYCLTTTVDPLGLMMESDEQNNSVSAVLDVTSNSVAVAGSAC
jgi:hypothetical protein